MSRTPHDKLFKRIFKEPQHAAEELCSILPARVVGSIDWSTLEREPESHVEESLSDRYSDLVFSAKAGGSSVIVYLLFEHQSTNDDLMGLRMLGYMVDMWTRFARTKGNVGKQLPLVLPVVLSHAVGGWTAKARFADLFHPDAVGLAPWAVPDFRYALEDLRGLSPDALRTRPVSDAVKLALWVLREARDGPVFLMSAVRWVGVLEALARDPGRRHLANAVLLYLLQVLDDEIMGEFHAIIATHAPATEGLTMTYAEKLISEGLERGRAEGARERACAAVLEVLMARGLPVTAAQRDRVESCDDLGTLSRWLRAAVTAEVTDAIFEA